MVNTMRGGVYGRAWYVLAFFGGFLGLAIAWLVLHQRDGFHPRGLVMWSVVGQLLWLGLMAAVIIAAGVAGAMESMDY